MFQTIKLPYFLNIFLLLFTNLFLGSCSRERPNKIPQIRSNFDEILEDQYLKEVSQKNANNKILILLPLSGPNANLGRGILNSCLLAAEENNNPDIDFIVIDTADKNLDINKVFWRYSSTSLRAIVGPVFCNEARRYAALFPNISMFTFSNNREINNNHIFTCGVSPKDEINEIFRYARKSGKKDFLIMLPKGQQAGEIMKYLRESIQKFGYSEKNDVEVIQYDYMSKKEATRYVASSGKRAVFILEPIISVTELPTQIDVFTLSSNVLQNKEEWEGCIFAFSDIRELFNFSDRYKSIFGRVPTTLDMVGYDIMEALCRSSRDFGAPFSLEDKHLHGCLGDFVIVKNKGVKRTVQLYRNTMMVGEADS